MKEKTAKKRNSAIELWRFLIAIAIVGFHIGFIIANTCDGANGYYLESSNWFIKKEALHQKLGSILGLG